MDKRREVVLVFDIGKTNKKLLAFDREYHLVYEKSERLEESLDRDGDPCEDLTLLEEFICSSLKEVFSLPALLIRAINFTSYGASIVYLDQHGKPMRPLYNYLKSYPQELMESLHQSYGGTQVFAQQTASPVLGSLNSGLQLYRLKKEEPEVFQAIHYALHLPQYLSYLLSNRVFTEKTSIGCHTALWDYQKHNYHQWVYQEGLADKFAEICPSSTAQQITLLGNKVHLGVGLHDSSAALIPYLKNFSDPFVLISTGTWSIALNPFNQQALSREELEQDCLFYLSYQGKPVKASRLFSGKIHEEQTRRIAAYFARSVDFFKEIPWDPQVITRIEQLTTLRQMDQLRDFAEIDLGVFHSELEAYYGLIMVLVAAQLRALNLVLSSGVKQVFVDGGFSQNRIFMELLAKKLPGMKVYSASMPQATAVGAALAIHDHWNPKGKISPESWLTLNDYSA